MMAVYADKHGTLDSSRHNWHPTYDGARQNSTVATRCQTAAKLLVIAALSAPQMTTHFTISETVN